MNIEIVPAPAAPFGYSYLIRAGSALQSPLLLAIRLYWGVAVLRDRLGQADASSQDHPFF